ncbi:hypothetical protein DL93DRAFT_1248648 [Clavulina sp. PMI_390]|nr:hypothetical protein DL93DRAFT_1248648 [Clavulina sp. PMI_390]
MVSKNRMLRNSCMDGEVKQRGDLEHADMERLGADAPDFDLREFRKNRDAFMKDRPTTYILEGDERASTRPKLNPSRNNTLPSYPKPSSPGPSKPSPRLKGADEAYRPVPYRSLETHSANQNARNTPRSPIKPPIALPAPAPPAPAPAPAPIGRPGHRSSFLDEPPPQMEIDEPPPSQGAATESVSSSQQPALWPSNDEPPTTASSAPNNDPFIMSRPTNGRANTEFTMDLSMLPSFQSIARMKGLMQRRLKLHNDSVTSTAQQSAPPSLYHRFEGKVVDYFPREVTQLAIAICPLCNVEWVVNLLFLLEDIDLICFMT